MEDFHLAEVEHLLIEETVRVDTRIYRDRTNPLEVSNDTAFRSLFRFRRQTFIALLDMLEGDLQCSSSRIHSLLPAQQLGIALAVIGGNTFQSHIGFGLQIAQSTVSRTLERVTALITAKADEFVMWPTADEAKSISRKFYAITGIPGIIGAIDGSHCRLIAPSVREHLYVNRKMYHSINVMVVATPSLTAISMSARFPGRSHDSRVFKESQLYADLAEKRKTGILLGDSAYAADRFLLKPILRPRDDMERRYTNAVCRGRVVVENFFGVLKRQFHMLHAEMRYDPVKASKIVTTCIALRNFAARNNEPLFNDLEDDEMELQPPSEVSEDSATGSATQRAVVLNYFSQDNDNNN